MYSYRLVNGRLEIALEEAEVLRLAADLYLEGYGQKRLDQAFADAGICGRRGTPLRSQAVIRLLCNEKIAGDMLLQKYYVDDPITKVERVNQGEKPQYLVEGSHEPILDRDTYDRVLAERARRAGRFAPRSGNYKNRKHYLFSSKIVCGCCGKHYTRKPLLANTKYEKAIWICPTYNRQGKIACDSKQIPEDILESVSAGVMGLATFDEAVFTARVKEIQVPDKGVLVFVFYDGHTVVKEWKNHPRSNSWNSENRQRAREQAVRQAVERRAGSCRK